MKFPSMFPCRRRLECAVAVALACASVTSACGPDFPESYFAMRTDALLMAPEAVFTAEIARLVPPGAPPHRAIRIPADSEHEQTLGIDIAEVKRAIALRGTEANRGATRGMAAYQYEMARRALEKWIDAIHTRTGQLEEKPWPDPPSPELPTEIPAEFRLYFAGALAWHQQRPDEARRAWRELLALPPDERRFRTVWAAFMLGRLAGDELAADRKRNGGSPAYAEARRRFAETRALVAAGFSDPLGLAAASWGWEGRAALKVRDFPEATKLYLAQYAAGDDTAVQSLQWTASDAITGSPRKYDELARDAVARRVVTAWFIAQWRPDFSEPAPNADLMKEWAAALERANIGAVPDADRVAWLAYEAGLFPLAERWTALAAPDSAEAQWIRAKLALRTGNLRDGEKLLRQALASGRLGESHRARVAAELGRVCLARDDFRGALAAAMQGGHWEDAAFVAERVMTSAELKAFVDDPPAMVPTRLEVPGWWPNFAHDLRHLLARRLVRDGEFAAAGNYFSAPVREKYEAYVADVRVGFDLSRPVAERAAAFWRAAQCVHDEGAALLGTELEPDWVIWGGSFSPPSSVSLRRGDPRKAAGFFAPTPAELERLEEQPAPEKRFHYRYRAADLAWWAAALLPNDSDETAEILTEAGGWLKARDPQGAERFYQALVIRCGNTGLGRAAARAHWFPKPTAPATGPSGI